MSNSRQAKITSPDSSAKRQTDTGWRITSITRATPPTAYKQKLQNSIFDVEHQNQPI
jgi:hypothetical protein